MLGYKRCFDQEYSTSLKYNLTITLQANVASYVDITVVFYITYIINISFPGSFYNHIPGDPFTDSRQIGYMALIFISISLIFIQTLAVLICGFTKSFMTLPYEEEQEYFREICWRYNNITNRR
jgi:hypothetical protein